MNKGLLIGVGALAVVGVGGYFWWRSRKSSESSTAGESETGALKSAGSTPSSESAYDETALEEPTISAPTTKKEARQQKRQTRRDCRAEAKAQGLKGKAKRQFKRECKAAGGVNADFAGEEADFAFNGYSSFD